MSPRALSLAAALAAAFAHGTAEAQQASARPEESALFGGEAAPASTPEAPAPGTPAARPTEDNLFGGGEVPKPEAAAAPADASGSDAAPERTGSAQAPDLVDRDAERGRDRPRTSVVVTRRPGVV